MASKKKVPAKKQQSIDEIASQSINELVVTLNSTQQQVYEALNNVQASLREAYEKRVLLNEAIKELQEELEELYGKEKAAATIQQLGEAEAEAKRKHDQAVKELLFNWEDEKTKLTRQLVAEQQASQIKFEDEARIRRIALEDEDRERALGHQKMLQELLEQKEKLDKQAAELGSFEERVKTESDKQVRIIKQAIEHKAQNETTEFKAQIQILSAERDGMAEEIMHLRKQVEMAQQAKGAAEERITSIAIKSMEAQSGAEALKKIEGIATEQAKSKGK